MASCHAYPQSTGLGRSVQLKLALVAVLTAASLAVAPIAASAADAGTTMILAPQADGALFSAAEAKQIEVFEFLAALSVAEEREAMWDRMAQCETGGNWQDPGQWAGGLGIALSTWLAVGGDDFAPRPDQATREQQIIVAERIAERFGIHAWGCADRIGF